MFPIDNNLPLFNLKKESLSLYKRVPNFDLPSNPKLISTDPQLHMPVNLLRVMSQHAPLEQQGLAHKRQGKFEDFVSTQDYLQQRHIVGAFVYVLEQDLFYYPVVEVDAHFLLRATYTAIVQLVDLFLQVLQISILGVGLR